MKESSPAFPSTAIAIADASTNPMDHIDAEIEKYLGVVRGLRSRRNVHAPVSRLPPELLTRIFSELCWTDQSSFPNSSYHIRQEPRRYFWIKVTHVCRLWRSVAIECASLWSRIPFFFPKWIPEMLSRSRGVQLVVEQIPRSEVGNLGVVLQQLERIRVLTMDAVSHAELQLISDQVQTPVAPCLESLSISSLDLNRDDPSPFLNLFRLSTPRLKTLRLSAFPVSWDSQLIRSNSLTSLAIQSLRPQSTLDQMLDVLRHTPNLTSFILVKSLTKLPDGLTFLPLRKEIVPLSYLQDMAIEMDGFACANLLDHLSYPRSSTLRLTLSFNFTTVAPLKIISPLIVPQCDVAEGAKPIRHLRVNARSDSWGGPGGFLMQGRVAPALGSWQNTEPQVSIGVDMPNTLGIESTRCDALTILAGSLVLPQLEILELYDFSTMRELDWFAMAVCLREVKEIQLFSGTGSGLATALATGLVEGQTSNFLPRICPSLRSLVLRGIDFEEKCGDLAYMKSCSQPSTIDVRVASPSPR
ncbi:hypothetical protein JAAARDRAFT_366821 [Jaapia argillacea MUCL 33604]|uniref:F-box domain-containing protein n=1 Tax=Jaapia argillacea MUCL 33604 TaxID=933084 RepID=A0A067QHW1_9AGAM|nr:hypothetical protein JAAARDRAFT_366821 [Jaapia argillacea MUCL 33604]